MDYAIFPPLIHALFFPQMFVVEAVSPVGVYEWAYSCARDIYSHTSWMTCASGGPPVMSTRCGLLSGQQVSFLKKIHADVCWHAGSFQAFALSHVLTYADVC